MEAGGGHGGGRGHGDLWKRTQMIKLVVDSLEGIDERKILCSTEKCVLFRKA